MQRAVVLAHLNGRILEAYSQRTTQVLRSLAPLRLVLPHLEPLLALNVDKEARKDALVVQCANVSVLERTPMDRSSVPRLFEAGKSIDKEFLAQISSFPVRIVIRYDDLEPYRVKRIEGLLDMAYRILAAWSKSTGLREALRLSFQRSEFERRLRETLRLYALEARALSHAVRLPLPLLPLRSLVAQRLLDTMNDVSTRLAREVASNVYRASS